MSYEYAKNLVLASAASKGIGMKGAPRELIGKVGQVRAAIQRAHKQAKSGKPLAVAELYGLSKQVRALAPFMSVLLDMKDGKQAYRDVTYSLNGAARYLAAAVAHTAADIREGLDTKKICRGQYNNLNGVDMSLGSIDKTIRNALRYI